MLQKMSACTHFNFKGRAYDDARKLKRAKHGFHERLLTNVRTQFAIRVQIIATRYTKRWQNTRLFNADNKPVSVTRMLNVKSTNANKLRLPPQPFCCTRKQLAPANKIRCASSYVFPRLPPGNITLNK